MYLVLGKENCPYCQKAIELLKETNTDYVYKSLDDMYIGERSYYTRLIKEDLKMKTVPVVLKLVGGYAELFDDIG
jgi:glutaredoxin